MTLPKILIVALIAIAGIAVGFSLYPTPATVHETVATCPDQLHPSLYSTRSIFDAAYAAASTSTSIARTIKGITVTHDLLAANLIADMFNQVATTAPMTVVLISTSHLSAEDPPVITSTYGWQTPYGVVPSDCAAIQELATTSVVSIDETPFATENGVSALVPFIKRSIPYAQIVPIIIKDSLPEADRVTLAHALYREFGSNVLVVDSFDFSRDLPSAVANLHDTKALSVLQNFDYDSIGALDTDSAPGIEVSLRLLEKMGATNFSLSSYANSAAILHDPAIEQTTGYIDGTFSVGPKEENETATILAFGDMMLDRTVRDAIEENGASYPFVPIENFLLGSDVVVANAEGPFTQAPSIASVNRNILTFTFDPATLPTLRQLGFTLFSQANNHAMNFGLDGLRESQADIRAAGIETFGDPMNDNPGPYYETIRGIKIAFVGYHQFSGTDTNVLAAIKSAKEQNAFVIVYPHWGVEYSLTASPFQIKEAHTFIDAGADLVLGAHPHVIEPIELYKNKAIFYSMGNFVFDQSNTGPQSQGLSVGITLTPYQVFFSLFPLVIQHAQTSLMPYTQRAALLSTMAHNALLSGSGTAIREGIASGSFMLAR